MKKVTFYFSIITIISILISLPLQSFAQEPLISSSPSSHDFGTIFIGSSSSPQTFYFENISDSSLIICGAGLSGINQEEFQVDLPAMPVYLNPGQAQAVNVSFAPTSSGDKDAYLRFYFSFGDPNCQYEQVPISGKGVELTGSIQVDIDIKPGSYPNSINLTSKGVVPVAILTTEVFDAQSVDPQTVYFANAPSVHWTKCDVDQDGDLDLLNHFRTETLTLTIDDIEAMLVGVTYDGIAIQGIDTINIVPKKHGK